MTKQVTYWFPAKTHGWGWGLPTVWQGWATLAVAFSLCVLGGIFTPREEHRLLYGVVMVGVVAALLAVCSAKGEPPAWRWGGK